MTNRFSVELTPRAFADIENIRAYLSAERPDGAENVRLAIVATIQHLSRAPKLGRDRPELGVRSIGVPRYSYTVYYRFDGNRVVIVHVRDDRRKPLLLNEL